MLGLVAGFACAQRGEAQDMASNIVFVGTYSYSINAALGTVQLSATELDNIGTSNSGTIRLELWLTTAPWDPNGLNTGYEIANFQPGGTSSGQLGAGQSFSNISHTGPLLGRPPPGTYFVTLAAAEYTGASPAIDNGYVVDSSGTFTQLVTVGANGSIELAPLPAISIDVQVVAEGDAGAHNMVFTLTQSAPVPYATSVRVDTSDETAFAGFDYQAVHRVVTFAPGATSATVSVPIYGNLFFEPGRAFEVNLSNPVGASVAPNYFDPTGTRQSTPQASNWGVIIDDDTPAGLNLPTDGLFSLQWYLYNTRVEYAWKHATGKGVKIAVFDQGIDPTNPDLRANDLVALGLNSSTSGPGGSPVLAGDNHGTHVAGIIGAARDGEGIVGVAYDARLVSIYTSAVFSPQYLTEIANAFRYATSVDVLNNSWGFGNLLNKSTNWAFLDDAKDPSFAPAFQALHDLAANGRNGLGTVVVQSAGNGFNFGDDTNLHNFQNSRYVITVGATDFLGGSSYFSTTGASILVSAPGGAGNGDFASILSTDRSGAAGENSSDFAFDDGTSFSSPIVAGVVALMLEVNPRLGFRDIQQILAYTAHQTDIGFGGWVANGATDWNGGGLRYNLVAQASGFGQVDALAAVRLATSWTGVPETVANTVDVIASKTVNLAIPDNSAAGISSNITIASTLVVERVDVTVNITHPFIGDLEVALISPSGTVSYLMYRPSQGSLSAVGSSQHDVHFTFDTVLDWGESAAGKWTLNVRDLKTGDVGTFIDWTLDLIGHNASNDRSFIYTNEFPDLVAADPARGILRDPLGGNDTINASALGSDDRIDLSGLTASSINGGTLNIAAGTTIRNAFGGDGNDLLIANKAGGSLYGMAGDDTLNGGAGFDALDGGAGNDVLIGGAGIDTAVYHAPRARYSVTQTDTGWTIVDSSGINGTDQLTNVERVHFSDTMLALDINGDAGQAYRLYQAAYNRVPDLGGLGFWIKVMDAGSSLTDVAGAFMASPEFKDMYGPALSHADFVDKLYQNVLHRPGEAGGVAFWLEVLDRPGVLPAGVLAAFAESAENQAGVIGVIGKGFPYIQYLG
jgi:subtilisin-like proprotein convertase family protein